MAQEKAPAAYERGVVRKRQRTPWHSLAHHAGDRRVCGLWCSGCIACARRGFLPLLQAVSSIGKTRNQLRVSQPVALLSLCRVIVERRTKAAPG